MITRFHISLGLVVRKRNALKACLGLPKLCTVHSVHCAPAMQTKFWSDVKDSSYQVLDDKIFIRHVGLPIHSEGSVLVKNCPKALEKVEIKVNKFVAMLVLP